MGGARAGEVASSIAVESSASGARRRRLARGRPARRQRTPTAGSTSSRRRSRARGMGTTFTAALVRGDEVAIGHVGDSRAYRFRDGELERLTEDHSLVEELVRQGKLTPEEAEVHPQRSIITRALGPEPEVEVDTFTARRRRRRLPALLRRPHGHGRRGASREILQRAQLARRRRASCGRRERERRPRQHHGGPVPARPRSPPRTRTPTRWPAPRRARSPWRTSGLRRPTRPR